MKLPLRYLPPSLFLGTLLVAACDNQVAGKGEGNGDSGLFGDGDGDSPGDGDGDGSMPGDGDGDGDGDADGGSSGDGDGDDGTSGDGDGGAAGGSSGDGDGDEGGTGGSAVVDNPLTDPQMGPPAGNPSGTCDIPPAAGLQDVTNPTTVVGDGTPESCTGDAFIAAVAAGGIITFDCGNDPHTIMLTQPAKVFNDASDEVVIDGGGLITLSGSGQTRILYQNTCDEDQHFTTASCNDQDHPRLTVQNLTFIDANSKSEDEYDGGGAIWVRGGLFKAINTRFFNNVCADDGPDVGGAAIRVFDMYQDQPAYIVNSTFGGSDELGNACSNGGGISSIGVSWAIINSLFSHNSAIGNGGNPAQAGTPGGGSGGAIYNDGNLMTLDICGTLIENNTVNAHGSAIFFVSNNHTGDIALTDTVIRNNCGGTWYANVGISRHDDTPVSETNVTYEECSE